MECSQCKEVKTPSRDLKVVCFPCDTCKNLFCPECTELTPSEIKCLPLQKRLLIFLCPKCRNYEFIDTMKQTIKDKEVIIDSKNETIKMLQEKLSSYENKQQLPLSYAEIASNNYEPKQEQKYYFPEIIIKAKLPQNAMKTKNNFSSNIKPADLKIGVS
ncbi:hypothetical protein JTB14_003620 [Gonioctena quinquepunctata]|nr:hypothetical protein JTB14_003620 [Gonioctena quinquepunctata]